MITDFISHLEQLLSTTDFSVKGMCLHYECALSQRLNELKRGLGLEGTKGYEVTGCYGCNGLNEACKAYMNNEELLK